MTFKEYIVLSEMGYWRGKGAEIPLPDENGRLVKVGSLDMRFEDYGFPGGGYTTNWYAELPDGGVISNNGMMWDSRYHPTQSEWKQYRSQMDATDKKPLMWIKVPEESAATNPALDGKTHHWWDYAEGLDDNGNDVLKPGLYRKIQVAQAG